MVSITWMLSMTFPTRLIQARKSQGLTQQGLADAAQLHVNQVKRYETGSAKLTLEGLTKLARTLHTSVDELLEGMIVKYEARRWTKAS